MGTLQNGSQNRYENDQFYLHGISQPLFEFLWSSPPAGVSGLWVQLVTSLSKILARNPPEYVFWKGPGLTLDTPIEDPGQDPSRMQVLDESQLNC